MALRDYYPFWKAHNERSRAGKLLLLDPDDESTIQVFFDDNIGHGSAHIVDVRDVRTGSPLPFQVSHPPSLVALLETALKMNAIDFTFITVLQSAHHVPLRAPHPDFLRVQMRKACPVSLSYEFEEIVHRACVSSTYEIWTIRESIS